MHVDNETSRIVPDTSTLPHNQLIYKRKRWYVCCFSKPWTSTTFIKKQRGGNNKKKNNKTGTKINLQLSLDTTHISVSTNIHLHS